MTFRIPASLGLAAVVTFSLFFLIQRLTVPTAATDLIVTAGPSVNFVRLIKDRDLVLKTRVLPERPANPRPAPRPRDVNTAVLPPATPLSEMPGPRIDLNFGIESSLAPMLSGEDTDAVPIFRMPPLYPPHAERRGLEGWVDLVFAVSKTGKVINPRVTDADPPGVFDRSAVEAVLKWQYRPKIMGGAAIDQTGFRVRIRFELENR